MPKVEMGKQYRTRDGREVRIYAVDGGRSIGGFEYPVHGAIRDQINGWEPASWTAEGIYDAWPSARKESDIIEVRPRIKRTVWLNVYPAADNVCAYHSRENADAYYNALERLACIKVEIDCEHGEGLE